MPKINDNVRVLYVNAGSGTIEYTLARKRVKNLNLRVSTGGKVLVSAPPRMPIAQVEAFIINKAGWIEKSVAQMQKRQAPTPCIYTKQQCIDIFTPLIDEIFPLFAGILNGKKPILRVRDMKSRWGSCNMRTSVITLNMRLAQYPPAVQEYVVMHEYVHFLHPNHGAAFHAEMARLMPDYKIRRKMLRGANF